MTTTNTQYRAECSACAATQAVGSDLYNLVLHGYKRPGWGYTVGKCLGARKPHFGTPEGRDLAAKFAASARAEAHELEAVTLPAARETAKPWQALLAVRDAGYVSYFEHEAHVVAAIRHYMAPLVELPQVVAGLRSYADRQDRRVAEWTRKDAVEVEAPRRGSLVHYRSRDFGAACTRRANAYAVRDASAVTCQKCIKWIEADKKAVAEHEAGKHTGMSGSWCPSCRAEYLARRAG